MYKMPEIRYYDSEEDTVSWASVQYAEIEVENDGKKLLLLIMKKHVIERMRKE